MKRSRQNRNDISRRLRIGQCLVLVLALLMVLQFSIPTFRGFAYAEDEGTEGIQSLDEITDLDLEEEADLLDDEQKTSDQLSSLENEYSAEGEQADADEPDGSSDERTIDSLKGSLGSEESSGEALNGDSEDAHEESVNENTNAQTEKEDVAGAGALGGGTGSPGLGGSPGGHIFHPYPSGDDSGNDTNVSTRDHVYDPYGCWYIRITKKVTDGSPDVPFKFKFEALIPDFQLYQTCEAIRFDADGNPVGNYFRIDKDTIFEIWPNEPIIISVPYCGLDQYYKVTEVLEDDHWSIAESENMEGIIKDWPQFTPNEDKITDVTVTNDYSNPVDVVLEADKELIGRELEKGMFHFGIFDEDGNQISSGTNDEDGHIVFDPIHFDKPKYCEYTMREIDEKMSGVSYDKSYYEIVLWVCDEGPGYPPMVDVGFYQPINDQEWVDWICCYVSDYWYDDAPEMWDEFGYSPWENMKEDRKILFTNTYEANGTGSLTFKGTKTLNGRDLKATDNFTFEIREGDELIGTATCDETGKIDYPTIDYGPDDIDKTFSYTIKETTEEGKGITVDDKEYTVKVKVTDNFDGTLKMEMVEGSDDYEALNFTNTYDATGSMLFEGTKTIEGREMTEDDIFTFTVSEAGEVIQTVENDADGEICFEEIGYTINDVGTHTYTVKEEAGDEENMTYDETEYTVEVEVTDNGDGTLSVEVAEGSDDPEELDFVNEYKPEKPINPDPDPKTGDTTNIVPYACGFGAGLIALIIVLFRRKKTDK